MKLKEAFERGQSLIEDLQGLIHQLQFSNKRFFNLKNAAVYCDLSVESLRRLCDQGKLTPRRPVGRILIDRQELDAYILSCTSTPRTGRGRHSNK